jgi:hypothetical protein
MKIEMHSRTSVLARAMDMWYYLAQFQESTLLGIENWLTECGQKGHRSALYSAKLGDT